MTKVNTIWLITAITLAFNLVGMKMAVDAGLIHPLAASFAVLAVSCAAIVTINRLAE
jgi:hypothetical protein